MKLFERNPRSAASVPDAIAVRVTDAGYVPDKIVVPAGRPVRLAFTRETPSPCAAEVSFPDTGVSARLPVGDRVVVELPALEPGPQLFNCPMGMLKGQLLAAERRDATDTSGDPR